MRAEVLECRFAEIGARVKVLRGLRSGTLINVWQDRRGEYFELAVARGKVSLNVVEADADERCLLLLVRENGEKSRFLCGFDERHWFVAAIPESARGVAGVASAKDALQPDEVRDAVARMRPRDRFQRRNVAYVRQGEWFFLAQWDFVVDERDVLRDEPLTRGRGKDHILELAVRHGGETVFVNDANPGGITVDDWLRLPERKRWGRGWREMVRNPDVWAKGSVRHPDHNTIVLHCWHRVLMNTEHQARAMRNVAFLD
ncbi:MAG TPA: hypothetical protein VKD47_06070 [Miltoncostaeaceae bacterium]|nr:hypothetical protein [Miltoncostaeaceae bacterium]